MKKLILLPLLFIAILTNAQFKFGAGGGINFASLAGDDASGFGSKVGINGGIMMEVKLPIELGVEIDAFYSTKGGSNSSSDLMLSYLDFPLVAKLYMLKVTNLQLGIQSSMLLGAEQEINFGNTKTTFDVKDQMTAMDFSAVIGFGVDVSKLHASLRYNIGLASAADGGDVKNNMITLTVGIWLKN